MEQHKHSSNKKQAIYISILLNFIITIVEFIGGLVSGSLSLISDSLHNLSDVLSLIISAVALKLSESQHTEEHTFGYKRAEVFAALLNSSFLIIVSFFLFKEAWNRFSTPVEINATLMTFIALFGLLANTIAVFLLKPHSHNNMNIKSSYLHLLSDAFSSVTVVIGGLFIYFFHIYWIDSILTFVIGIYVLVEGYKIIVESLRILMQFTPKGINLQQIKQEIENISGINSVHHVHMWCVTETNLHFEAHINVEKDIKISETASIKKEIECFLMKRYKIDHCTLQFEYCLCNNTDLIFNKRNS